MQRAERLPFAVAALFIGAGDAERAAVALAHSTPVHSIGPLLVAVSWVFIAYRLWRQRTMRVDFKDPDGVAHHALLVGPKEMNHGQKMRVQELLDLYQDDTIHPFNVGSKILEKLIAEVVKSWSLDLPVPHGDVALLAEVPDWAYEPLVDNVEEHRDRLDFNRTRSTSSASKTPSEDSSSPDKSPQTTP